MPTKKKNPPKKQKTIMSYFRTPDIPGSSRLTESTQPGGATGGAKSRAAGSDPGGATGSQDIPSSSRLTESTQPGGVTGGAAESDPGDGAKGSQPSVPEGSNLGGATGSQSKTGSSRLSESTQPSGGEGSNLGGASGGATGGATGGASGGASGGATGGAAWSDPGDGVKFSQPSGGEGSNLGGATGSQTRNKVKNENGGDFPAGHLHHFTVKFSRTECNEYAIDCDEPRTVLEAIQSTEQYGKKMKTCPDENIVIQLGKMGEKYIVATHFPCSCIGEGESLVISFGPEKVEVARDRLYRPIQSQDKYSVFYIDTIGGKNAKTKKLFRSNAVKEFKYLCVYGEKGITVKEALERDGRFAEDLGHFTLSDSDNPNRITEQIQKVDNLGEKEFKLCLPRNRRANDSSGLSSNSPQRSDTTPAVDEAQQRGIRVRPAIEKSGNIEEVYEAPLRQFPDLNKCMESRFPGDSEALNLRKENFGKTEQSFSDTHRVRKLLKLGESVCKIDVEGVSQGTGFVLLDNFILTNAHYFSDCVEGQKLKEGIDVFAKFEDPESKEYCFQLAHPEICYVLGDLDYAVLEIMPVGENYNHKNREITNTMVPPGLLKIVGPMPPNGEVCIIGHPAGGVKKMDPTFIIEKDNKDYLFTLCAINHAIKNDPHADSLVYYNTFMYHGASGSPVFDAQGRVFGLHTGGFPKSDPSAIEYGQSLLAIFEHFVNTLKVSGKDELLERVKKEVKGNAELEKVFKSVVEESMDTD